LSSSLFRCNKKQNSALLPGSAFFWIWICWQRRTWCKTAFQW